MNKNFKGYDRIGQSKINRQDCKMTIVEYKNSDKIVDNRFAIYVLPELERPTMAMIVFLFIFILLN